MPDQAVTPQVANDKDELHSLLAGSDRPRAVVMTMGALHAGHAELMREARRLVGPDGQTITTIFVNPTQFAEGEDLDKYPRTFQADLDMCAELGVDVVFAPTNDVMYPNGDPVVTVDPGPLAALYEGAARPTHFRGVLTVVNKFLMLIQPDYAIFGEKDYQQLTLIRQMVADLDVSTQIIGVPTIREESGLALSSRNRYLSAQAAETALRIPEAIAAGQRAGARGPRAAQEAALAILQRGDAAVEVEVQYVAVTDPMMGLAPERGVGRIIITAIVDGTRLLDNAAIDLGPGT